MCKICCLADRPICLVHWCFFIKLGLRILLFIPSFCFGFQVWKKIVLESARAILVTPLWPLQPWFTEVRALARDSIAFSRRTGYLIHPAPEMRGDPINKILLEVFLFLKGKCLKAGYLRRLWISCSLPGRNLPGKFTPHTCISGPLFVSSEIMICTNLKKVKSLTFS